MASQTTHFDELLENNGPIAIIIKQFLRPAEGEGEPVFPPTYPMPTYRGRVHTIRDGEYRVDVELPPFRQDGSKKEEKPPDVAGYNIDEFKDGSNVCEIDSPQSQANRLEPLFKTIKNGALVPQITIRVGGEPPINILDAGHRAADAVVRFSSLVDQFHSAFIQAKRGNHVELARLAPTSLLFGVWDSRATQVKLPRIIKAEIRATKVEKLTRSAQFNPVIDYVAAGGVEENLDKGEGEKNPLSAEGMKHVPAPRAHGGVTVHGQIRRVIRINLVALRELRAVGDDGTQDKERTDQLQKYVLGLALVAASQPVQFNLREGCLLCQDGRTPASSKLVKSDGTEEDFAMSPTIAEDYAETAAKSFFGDKYNQKNHENATFETGVANRYLAMSPENRRKLARNGPISEAAIRRFEEKGKDPLKLVSETIKEANKKAQEAIKAAKKADAKFRGKSAVPVVIAEAFKTVSEKLDELASDDDTEQPVKEIVTTLQQLIAADADTAATFKLLDERIKQFNKQRKGVEAETGSPEPSTTESA